jgi:hypothetical protein
MTIRVECQCGRSFDLPESAAGKSGKCRSCRASLMVPNAIGLLGEISDLDSENAFVPKDLPKTKVQREKTANVFWSLLMPISLLGVVLLATAIKDRPRPEPKPQPIAQTEEQPKFDARDIRRTAIWLLSESSSLAYSAKIADEEQSNNPLRKEKFQAHASKERDWQDLANGFVGKQVEWTFHIGQIHNDYVYITSSWKDSMLPGKRFVKIAFVDPDTRKGYSDLAKAMIGKHISQEEAISLDRGDMVRALFWISSIECKRGWRDTYPVVEINLLGPIRAVRANDQKEKG